MEENLGQADKLLEHLGEQVKENVVNPMIAKLTQKEIEEGKLEPLSAEEIGIAKNRISELHPMSQQPLDRVLPYLCCCLKIRDCSGRKAMSWASLVDKIGEANEEEAYQDKKQASDRMSEQIKEYGGQEYQGEEPKLKNSKQKSSYKGDPFNDYGYGFIAYFKLLKNLLVVYFLISLMMWYVMWNHAFGNAIENKKSGLIAKANAYSLGNLGFSKHKCYNQYLGLKTEGQTLSCSKGKIGGILFKGVIPANSAHKHNEPPFYDLNGQPIYNDFCGNSTILKLEDRCEHDIFEEMFSKTFNENCFGKSDCLFNMVKDIDTTKTKNPKCQSDKAKVYIQFECEVNKDII